MAEPNKPAQPAAVSPAVPKPRPQNPALRMLGIPNLPRKLPSRNWLIFLTITGSFTAAIIYDRREKKRATAKWRHAVAPLASETITRANQLPRKLTIFLEAPPGDGLRVAQDHFIEYAKPVLAASGLDWEFVQGRQQGDVRAAVAEKIRRARRVSERPGEELPSTDESIVEDIRRKNALPQFDGAKGDIILGRHTWKEYIRGLHEGWLGPLDPPLQPVVESQPKSDIHDSNSVPAEQKQDVDGGEKPAENGQAEQGEEKKPEKPERPPQPPSYNTVSDYETTHLPAEVPTEFDPSIPLPFPHRLGFSHTLVRLGRFLNRRALADNIGRDVAAVCFATARDWRQADGQCEQQLILQREEDDWPRSLWKDEAKDEAKDKAEGKQEDKPEVKPEPPKEKIWTSPVVMDERVVGRMRRFELSPGDEARAAAIVVPEEEVEGFIKGSFRSLFRWGASSWNRKPMTPNVGSLNED